jgi:hypothetical protein
VVLAANLAIVAYLAWGQIQKGRKQIAEEK